MLTNLIPTPKHLTRKTGRTSLQNMKVLLSQSCDSRLFKAAKKLADELAAETRTEISLTKVLGEPTQKAAVRIIAGDGEGEHYQLIADGKSVTVKGDSLAGTFYGIQTLRQLIRGGQGEIPNVEIDDAPDMQSRGFYQDISRGRVPTVESTKRLIDLLAYYKENAFQLYIEHTFLFEEYVGITHKDNALTAAEIMELDDYCYDNFIDFVPSLSTFGHLFRLLDSPKWHKYCELDKYEPHKMPWHNSMLHHTIDASNPESIKLITGMIDQYIPLFRSRYFNICCDETFDLGKGRNQGKDTGKLYLSFTGKLIEHLQKRGKTVMMWGDIILNHPEILGSFPKDVIMLNWSYAPNPNLQNAVKFREAGYRQILCPGTSCWNFVSEVVGCAEQNIIKMIRSGHENHALGSLNTAWGDYGHVSPLTASLYGLVLAAALSWNQNEEVPSASFDRRVSAMVYDDPTGKAVALLRELGALSDIMSWGKFCHLQYGTETWMGGSQNPTELANAASKALKIADGFRKLPVQNDIIRDLTIAAEGEYILCMSAAKKYGGRKRIPDGFLDSWCQRYAASWRRDNKESELHRILDVIYHCM